MSIADEVFAQYALRGEFAVQDVHDCGGRRKIYSKIRRLRGIKLARIKPQLQRLYLPYRISRYPLY